MTESSGGGRSKEIRLQVLRELIDAGEYYVPAGEVADAILRHARAGAKVARSVRPASDHREDGEATTER